MDLRNHPNKEAVKIAERIMGRVLDKLKSEDLDLDEARRNTIYNRIFEIVFDEMKLQYPEVKMPPFTKEPKIKQ